VRLSIKMKQEMGEEISVESPKLYSKIKLSKRGRTKIPSPKSQKNGHLGDEKNQVHLLISRCL
jgi:hypothetical protein